MTACPCRGCTKAYEAGYEAGKRSGAAEERDAILEVLEAEARRLDGILPPAGRFVRFAADLVRLWRIGPNTEIRKRSLRGWLA